MLILSVRNHSILDLTLKAREMLLSGQIISYPTETFYAIGARFDAEESLRRIYSLKNRQLKKAMPLIVGNISILSLVACDIPIIADKLMESFWPGPLTLIFKAKDNIADMITAGTGKVAVRIPGQSFALELAKSLNVPITATSANISGMPPAADLDTVMRYFDDSLDAIVDCGRTHALFPSTIVDVTGPELRILREGMIRKEDIFSIVS